MNHIRLGILVVGALPALASATQRTDLNAFLDVNVSTTRELVQQVEAREDVRDRYLRHYGMSEAELYAYLSSLRLHRMPEAETVTVYSVPGSGQVKSHRQLLHKGELIFVDRKGHGALLARCGNPLAAGPTNRRNMALESVGLEGAAVAGVLPLPEPAAPPMAVLETRPAVSIAVPSDALADEVVAVPPVTTSVITEPAPPPAAPVGPGGGGGGQGIVLPLLPILGGGTLIGIITSHHGHGGGGGAPAPAPEPATLVCLAAGSVLLMRRRKNR